MWQTAFLLNQAIKCLEAHFMTAIMAEKRQELSQRTDAKGFAGWFKSLLFEKAICDKRHIIIKKLRH
jgi:hypothetical protein